MEEIKTKDVVTEEAEGKDIEAFLEKLMGDLGNMDKPDRKINVVVTVDGKEEANVDFETLFCVGVRHGEVDKRGAQMAQFMVGNFGPRNAAHIRNQALMALAEHVNA